MNLSKNNFSKSACKFQRPGNIDIEGTVYTYESGKNLFDVVIIGGRKYYQKNMAGYTTDAERIEPIHRSIETHYNI